MNPHRWHHLAFLLHRDGKNWAPPDTAAHRAICSADNFHKFCVCTLFTVHLMPIQWDFFQKESFSCLDSSEELRFANSYCKNTFKAHKNTAFIFTFNRAHWNMGYQNLEAELPRDWFLNGSVSDFSPTCGRVHWIANKYPSIFWTLFASTSGIQQICLALIYYINTHYR